MGKLTKAFEKSYSPQKGEGSIDHTGLEGKSPGADVFPSTSTPATGPAPQKGPDRKGFFENEKWNQRLKLTTDPHSPLFESFRRLRTPILYPSSGIKAKTILVTSVGPNEGKGFICANLGVAIAQDIEHHALLLDCDFRHPTLAGYFGLTNDAGIVDYLKDNVELSLLIRETGQPKLSMVPCGKPPENPSEMLTSSKMTDLIREVSERHDDRIVLFDSPPSIVASETTVLAKQLDGVILVVRHGVSKREHVKKFVDALGRDKIIGIIFNAYPESTLESFVEKKLGYGYGYSSYYAT